MPTLMQRLRFLRGAGAYYTWLLVQRKLGRKRLEHEVDGARYNIPLDAPGGVQLMLRSELWMTPLLRKLLPLCPGSFVDVGANVGSTLLNLRAADGDRPWIGFEPSPDCCATIRAFVAANAIRNTTLIEAALGDADGTATLHGVSGTDGSSSLIESFRPPENPVQGLHTTVRVAAAASFMSDALAAQVGIIKIDVEGYELEVMRGLGPVIRRDQPVMICEILPCRDDGSARAREILARQAALADEITKLGYRMIRVDRNGGCEAADTPVNTITWQDANYVLVPAARFDALHELLAPGV